MDRKESPVEQQIREAIERGDFDDLPRNPGVDGLLRGSNKCIVGRDIRFFRDVDGGTERNQRDGKGDQQGTA